MQTMMMMNVNSPRNVIAPKLAGDINERIKGSNKRKGLPNVKSTYNVFKSGMDDDVEDNDIDEHEAGGEDGGPNRNSVGVHCIRFGKG